MIRVLCRWGSSPYTRYVIGIGWHSTADTKNVIYGIGWNKIADTNNLLYRLTYVSRYQYVQPIYNTHTPLFRLSTTVVAATVSTESNCSDRDYQVFFQLSLICFFPFAMVYIDLDFDFTMISLMDLGLFSCIYSKRYRIILMYIF
jgi:hypothetical protein